MDGERTVPPRPLIVELVGPAGAGKTAALRAIGTRDGSVRAGFHLDRLRSLPMILRHTLALAPTGFGLMGENPLAWWPGMRHLLRLTTLRAVLSGRTTSSTHRAVVLDEGPVFSLTRLRAFQNVSAGNGRWARSWRAALDEWANALDLVVWLDAPDPLLAQRIRRRFKAHRVKDGTEREVFEFLQRYRSAYQAVLAELSAAGHVKVVEIDTAVASADHVAGTLLTLLDRMQRPPGPAANR